MVDVVRDVKIPWDPNSKDIVIRTDSETGGSVSEEGSYAVVRVVFYDDNKKDAGRVVIKFTSPIQYRIGDCTSDNTIPVSPPTDTDKTWRISYNPTEKTVLIYCNEVEVLNLVISDSVCTNRDNWRDNWERNPTKIKFLLTDTASDQYCLAAGM